MLGVSIAIGVFFGIMFSTLLISMLSGVTIKIFELFRIYKRGNIYTEVTDYITGAGMHRTAKVFMEIDKNGNSNFANGKVFGYLLMIFLPLSIIISIIIYFIISLL